MVAPFAPNPGAAEAQTHNEKPQVDDLHPPANVGRQKDDTPPRQPRPPPDSGNYYSQHYKPNATIWALYLKETEAEDRELAQLWQTGLDQLLIFAGLFGAILTAFLIESRKDLKEDPFQRAVLLAISKDPAMQTFQVAWTSVAVNAAWFCSLGLTLISALAAVLAKGWLAKYTPATPGIRSYDACERHLRYLRAQQWRLGMIVAGIPFLIQIALFLFAVGLIIFILGDNFGIGIGLLVLTALATALYGFCTLLPWFSPACPFQTTMSDFIPGIAMNSRYSDKKDFPTLPKSLSQWKGFAKFLREVHRKPEKLEIEADILAWLLTNSTTEEALEEAIKAVAGANSNQYIPDALDKYGASSILIERLSRCLKIVPGLPITVIDEIRAEAYLYAMLRIGEPSSRVDQNKVLLMEDCVQPGKPLHRWEDYTDYLQPLALAVRMKFMLAAGRDEDSIQRERSESNLKKMTGRGMIPYVRWVLLNAMVEGLLEGKTEVRKMSGQVLGKLLQVSDTSTMLGDGDRANKVILAMTEILKESNDTGILKAVMSMARSSQFQSSIGVIISEIVNLLKHSKQYICRAGVNALLQLLDQTELRCSIDIAILEVVNFLKDSDAKIRLAAVEIFSYVSEQTNFQSLVITAIPEIVALLKDSDIDVFKACATALSKFSEKAEFRALINSAVLDMVKSLNSDDDRNLQVAYAYALSKLSCQAEFRTLIVSVIPEIVNLLKDSESNICVMCVEALSTLSAQVEFRSLIYPAISEIIGCLKDGDLNVCQGGASALSILSGQAEFRALIGTQALDDIINLLKDSDSSSGVRVACARTLSKLSEEAEFQHSISNAVPDIIQLLMDDDWEVTQEAPDILLTISNHVKLQPSVIAAIPKIVKLVRDGTWNAAEALSKLSEQAEIRPSIGCVIPEIITLLKTSDKNTVWGAIEVLYKLSPYTEFHSLIGPIISVIVDLAKDHEQPVQRMCIKALSEFCKQVELQHWVVPAIPVIVNSLMDTDNFFVCWMGANALLELFQHAEARHAIGNAIWSALLSQRPLHSLSDHQNTSSSHLVVGHLGTHLKGFSLDPVSTVGTAGLIQYWSLNNRFQVFDGVCILDHLADIAQMFDSHILAHLFMLEGVSHFQGLLNIICKVNKHSWPFQQSIYTVIPDIINLLKNDENLDIRRKCADTLLKLLEKDNFHHLIASTAVPKIVSLLQEGHSDVCKAHIYILAKLSEQAEFRPLIAPAIPGIVNLLQDNHWEIHKACAEVLLTLSKQAEFRPSIQFAISGIVDLLENGDERFRQTGAVVLSKLSSQAEFQPSIGAAIPKIVNLLKDGAQDVHLAGENTLSHLSKQAEYQPFICAAIPEILDLFNISDSKHLLAGATALSIFSKHVEFQSSIELVIPEIVKLLKDSDKDIRQAGADSLSRLSKLAEYRPLIGTAIPEILDLFNASDRTYLSISTTVLSNLSMHVEFQPLIGRVIPEIVKLLADTDIGICMACADTLLNLSAQAEFQSLIKPAIPSLLNLHKEEYRASCFSRLWEQAEFQPFIHAAIAGIISSLSDDEATIREAGVSTLLKLSREVKFHPLIGPAICEIVALLKDGSNWSVCWKGIDMILELSEQAEFHHLIGLAIPDIVSLLNNKSRSICWLGARALLQLSKQDYCLQDAFPTIVSILLSLDADHVDLSYCTQIFARHAFNDFFRDKIVHILIFTFECLYFHDGSHKARALAVIQVLAEYVSLAPILHEIWAIYSFAHNVLSITRSEDIKFFVEQMQVHGLLKSI